MSEPADSRYSGSDRMIRHGLLFLALYCGVWGLRWVTAGRYWSALIAASFGTLFIIGWAIEFAIERQGGESP